MNLFAAQLSFFPEIRSNSGVCARHLMSSYSCNCCIYPLCHKPIYTQNRLLCILFPFPHFPTKNCFPEGSVKPPVHHIQGDSESHLDSDGFPRHAENTCHEEFNSSSSIYSKSLLPLGTCQEGRERDTKVKKMICVWVKVKNGADYKRRKGYLNIDSK